MRHILTRDVFHLVEVNERFVESLRKRFEREPEFRRVADQSTIYHLPIQELQVAEPYDFIISGLPVNNFSMETWTPRPRHQPRWAGRRRRRRRQRPGPGGETRQDLRNGHERRRVARVGTGFCTGSWTATSSSARR